METIPVQHEFLEVKTEDGIAWVTMNRPERLNALNVGLVANCVSSSVASLAARALAWWSSRAPGGPFAPATT